MSSNTLAVKFQLRYDTISHWLNSEDILMPGEIAIAAFPSRSTIVSSDSTPDYTPPAIGIKVGDGLNYFSELPWLQGIAADVYDWAKASTKPTYSATEITGLAEYIATHSGGGSGGGDVSSSYRIIYDNNHSKYILQQYDDTENEWVAAAGDEINLSAILTRLNNIERWANGASSQLGNIELPLASFIYDEVMTYFSRLNVDDLEVAHQFVTAVEQIDGKIRITRSILSASDITAGVLGTPHGGTGLSFVDENEVLIGSSDGTITTRQFVTEIDVANRTAFATVGALVDYIAGETAGLTNAMHFIGETQVPINTTTNNHADPRIAGYDFRNAQPGDIILANDTQEYMWTGTEWHLLGDKSPGSISNESINENAAIAQSKIDGLIDALASKVDKVDGKGLSSNDYTTEEKNKLRDIEDNAQENVIEHILVNGTESQPDTINGQPKSVNLIIPVLSNDDINKLEGIEPNAQENVIENIFINDSQEPLTPTTINNLPKSVKIEYLPYTQEEQEKLQGIEAEAQVNSIEEITINNVVYTPNENKNIDITIDFAELKANTEEYWAAHPIIPGAGELIIYTDDETHLYPRLKVGDGSTAVTALPFIDAGSINGSSIATFTYANAASFPRQGRDNTLYIDLSTGIIYFYTNNAYKQLSSFAEKTPVSNITSWLTGTKPTFTCESGRLKISTGILPSLYWETPYVVRNIVKEVAGQ